MSNLEIIQIPLLIDNYAYLLIEHTTGTTTIIDPSEAKPVLDVLSSRKISLNYIWNTHHHLDHVGGNLEIKEATGCTIICSHTDLKRISDADKGVGEGDAIKLGNLAVQVMEIPGHTIGHIAYYIPEERALFCGDTLFSLGCGKLFEGTAEQMWNSLRRIADLPRSTRVFCGHEYTEANGRFALTVDPHNHALQSYYHHVSDLRKQHQSTIPSTIETEVECNPFLRAPQLVSTLNLPQGMLPHDIFAILRQKKNNFTA